MSGIDPRNLFNAARSGDAESVRRLVAGGADLESRMDTKDGHGMFFEHLTPLMVAAGSPESNCETVAVLLELGADPKATSSGGVTALWYAAGGADAMREFEAPDEVLGVRERDFPQTVWWPWGGGDAARLKLLLEAGGDPNETADNGRSALCEAARAGDPERVRMLLDAGASPHPGKARIRPRLPVPPDWVPTDVAEHLRKHLMNFGEGFDSFTIPLFMAVESGSAECVRLLLSHAARAETLDSQGKSAVDYARNPEVLEALREAATFAPTSDKLLSALKDGRYEVARALLAAGADLNKRVARDETILGDLVFSGSPNEALEVAIDAGADVLSTQWDGQTMLHLAAWHGDNLTEHANPTAERLIRFFVARGVPIDAPDDQERTALHFAVGGDWESPVSVRELLFHGADPNPADNRGRTPLMDAAQSGALECVELLLAGGANPKLRDGYVTDALAYACKNLAMWKREARWGWLTRPFRPGNKLVAHFLKEPEFSREQVRRADEIVRLLEDAVRACAT